MTTSTEKTAELLHAVLTDLASVVGGIGSDQLHLPTPCAAFDVEQLRDHVLGWLTTFAAGFADPNGQAPRADTEGYRPPSDAVGEVRTAADQLDRALRAGAAERPLRLGEAAMPGDLALGMILWEYQVHGWDLAVATGQPWAPPVEAAQASLAFAPGMLTEEYQGEGEGKIFGLPVDVPAGACALDRLIGLSGRDPRWQQLLPALAGEDHVCPHCRLSYQEVSVERAVEMIRSVPAAVRDAVAAIPPESRHRRPDSATWSVTEYACHLRDVYATYTIRLHRARTEDRPALEPMFNDLRARRFRYNERDVSAVLDELAATVAGFCEEIAHTRPEHWDRVVTRLPGEERTARWLVRQALHEGQHHLADIRNTGEAVIAKH